MSKTMENCHQALYNSIVTIRGHHTTSSAVEVFFLAVSVVSVCTKPVSSLCQPCRSAPMRVCCGRRLFSWSHGPSARLSVSTPSNAVNTTLTSCLLPPSESTRQLAWALPRAFYQCHCPCNVNYMTSSRVL